jgi:hypothetical protein
MHAIDAAKSISDLHAWEYHPKKYWLDCSVVLLFHKTIELIFYLWNKTMKMTQLKGEWIVEAYTVSHFSTLSWKLDVRLFNVLNPVNYKHIISQQFEKSENYLLASTACEYLTLLKSHKITSCCWQNPEYWFSYKFRFIF